MKPSQLSGDRQIRRRRGGNRIVGTVLKFPQGTGANQETDFLSIQANEKTEAGVTERGQGNVIFCAQRYHPGEYRIPV